MTKKQKEKLADYAVKVAESVGFVMSPGPLWSDYYLVTKGGLLGLTIRDNADIRSIGICCFMRFRNPHYARINGFDCNPHSGKYNFHGLEIKEQIEILFLQFERKNHV